MNTLRTHTPQRARAWSVSSWARSVLRCGDAVILDTETTDLFGHVCQISVIDLAGQALMNTLVLAPAPIALAAAAVHGITDDELCNAPVLEAIAPHLLELTRGRIVLAYNAPYDRKVLVDGLRRVGFDPKHLADPASWACLMRARACHDGQDWVKLDGPHDALGDCRAALEVLHQLAGRST